MHDKPWHQHYDYNILTAIRYPRLPAHGLYLLPAGTFPDKPALNFYGTEITCWELRSQVRLMTNALGALKVSKGQREGIQTVLNSSSRISPVSRWVLSW